MTHPAASKSTEEIEYDVYGIVPGPVWNNFGKCDPEDYVCTYESYNGNNKQLYDLYVTSVHAPWQSYMIRFGQTTPGDYYSGPLLNLLRDWKDSELLNRVWAILTVKGDFYYKKRRKVK